MRTGWCAGVLLTLAAPALLPGSALSVAPRPVAVIAAVTGPVGADAHAHRVHRRIPHPSDAVCVDPALVDRDPVTVLQRLMAGQYGPIGQFGAADVGGITNIGGPHQWLFALGDTLVGPNDGVSMPDGMNWVNNAYLVQDDNCFWVEWGGKATGATPRSLALASPGSWYWFGDAYVQGDRLYQFVTEVRSTGGGGLFDFDPYDTDLVISDLAGWNLEAPTVVEHGPWEQIDPDHIEGIFNVDTGNPEEVVFGVVGHLHPQDNGMVRLGNPADPLAPWQAWNGTAWGPLTAMATVFSAPPGDSTGVRPFRWHGEWYALGWSWTVERGMEWWVRRSGAMTGPYVEVKRAPIAPLPGQALDAIQYWHTLEGGYVLADGVVLMQWANHGDLRPGAPLRLVRPAFTRFRLATLTADLIT